MYSTVMTVALELRSVYCIWRLNCHRKCRFNCCKYLFIGSTLLHVVTIPNLPLSNPWLTPSNLKIKYSYLLFEYIILCQIKVTCNPLNIQITSGRPNKCMPKYHYKFAEVIDNSSNFLFLFNQNTFLIHGTTKWIS